MCIVSGKCWCCKQKYKEIPIPGKNRTRVARGSLPRSVDNETLIDFPPARSLATKQKRTRDGSRMEASKTTSLLPNTVMDFGAELILERAL